MFRRPILGWLMVLLLTLGSNIPAYGQLLTSDLEVRTVTNVGYSWQIVTLENSYSDPIIVCTYNLASDSNPTATTRIRSVTSSSFQLKIQQFEDSSTVTAGTVYCIISDEGAYNADGLKYEARKVTATTTSGLSVPGGWNNNIDVSTAVTQN